MRIHIITHYFLTELCNKVREQYEKQFPGGNLPSNKAISCVIHKSENEYFIDDLLHSCQPTDQSVGMKEEVRKHMQSLSHTSSRKLPLRVGLSYTATH